MEKKLTEQFKSKLEKLKERIRKELLAFTEKKPHSGDYQSKFYDLGQEQDDEVKEVEIYQSHLSMEGRLKSHLRRVNRALRKLKKGSSYGKCEACGKAISVARLKVYPEARYCMRCHRTKKLV